MKNGLPDLFFLSFLKKPELYLVECGRGGFVEY